MRVYCQILRHVAALSLRVVRSSVCTYDIEGEGNEAMVSAQDTERLLPLDQREEVICHRLTVEEVVDAKKKVPVRIKDRGQSE